MDMNIPAESLALTAQAPTLAMRASVPAIAFSLPANAPVYSPVQMNIPVIEMTLTVGGFVAVYAMDVPVIPLTFTANTPQGLRGKAIPVAAMALIAQPTQISIEPNNAKLVRTIYRAYLTGDQETPAVDHLELPISSFQSRRRNGEQSYLSITVPNPTPYIDGVNARPNGDIVVYSGFEVNGVETLTELVSANFNTFRYDLGPQSGSMTLTGYRQTTYTNPKTRALSGVSYKSVTDGAIRVRCAPDMWLNPGDTADLGGGETFVIDSISYTINPTSASMEVAEVSE